MRHFYRQAVRVRIGQQNRPFSLRTQGVEEGQGIFPDAGAVAQGVRHAVDVQIERGAPVIKAIPAQRVLHSLILRVNQCLRLRQWDPAPFAERLRYMLQPEVAVKLQIEQRAIHVQQNGIDAGPVKIRRHKKFLSV